MRKFIAAASVAALAILGGATAANAQTHVPHPNNPFRSNVAVTEIQANVYGSGWVLNDFQDQAQNNAIASVFDDLGAPRTYFFVRNLGTQAADLPFAGDQVVSFQDENGAYLSEWNNANPAVNGWRGRWVYAFNNNIKNDVTAQWVVVPSGNGFALVNESNTNLALTVAQGNGTSQTNGTPNWSGTALLPFTGAVAQQFTFKVPPQRPVLSVTQSQAVTDAGNGVVPENGNRQESNFSIKQFTSPSATLVYSYDVHNVGSAEVNSLSATPSVDVVVTGSFVNTGSNPATHGFTFNLVNAPVTVSVPDSIVAGHSSEVVTGTVNVTSVESAVNDYLVAQDKVYDPSDVSAPNATVNSVHVTEQVAVTGTVNGVGVTNVAYHPQTLTINVS